MALPNKNFKKSFRGYNKEAVDEYISMLEHELAACKESEESLYHKLGDANEELERFRQTERTGNELIEDARSQADKIVSAAKSNAASCILKAKKQCNDIMADMASQVKSQKAVYDSIVRETEDFRNMLFEKYKEHIGEINKLSESVNEFNSNRTLDSEIAELLNGADKKYDDFEEQTEAEVTTAEREKRKTFKSRQVSTPADYNTAEQKNAAESAVEEAKQQAIEAALAVERAAYKAREAKSSVNKNSEDTSERRSNASGKDPNRFNNLFTSEDVKAQLDDGNISNEDFFSSIFDSSEKKNGMEDIPFEPVSYGFENAVRDSDSGEFYGRDDANYNGNAASGTPTEIINNIGTPNNNSGRKKWKAKKSFNLTDEFDAVDSQED